MRNSSTASHVDALDDVEVQTLLEAEQMAKEKQLNTYRIVLGFVGLAFCGIAWEINTYEANLVFGSLALMLILIGMVLRQLFRNWGDQYIGWVKFVSIFLDLLVVHGAYIATSYNHSGVLEFYHSLFPVIILVVNFLSGLRLSVAACVWSGFITLFMGGMLLTYTVTFEIIPVSAHSVFGQYAINTADEAMRLFFISMPPMAIAGTIAQTSRNLIMQAAKESMERNRLEEQQSRLLKYLSKDLAEIVLKNPDFQLGGKRQNATIMFTDIRNFTPLAESVEPEEVVQLLNDYFTEMVSIVFKYEGMLDKFLGDGLMAAFGVPFEQPDSQLRATLAALEMVRAVDEFNRQYELLDKKLPPLQIGIGIAYGPVVAGNIGSLERMEFTCIGDTVNFAARLEALNKSVGTNIIISKSMHDAVQHKIPTRPLPPIKVKGKKGEPELFTINPSTISTEAIQEFAQEILAGKAAASLQAS